MILVKNITNLLQYLISKRELEILIEEQKKERGEQLTYPITTEAEKQVFIAKVKAYKADNLTEKLESLVKEGFNIEAKQEPVAIKQENKI